MKNKKTFYLTTPIYFPSGNWHLGTCYTTVMCDALARFKRMQGYDVFYLTGTDEHGQKIETNAKNAGVSPKEYVDEKVENLKKIWTLLGISYDKFIRTTDAAHEKTVQAVFTALYNKGDIYLSQYEGHYCVPCETFWTDAQLKDGKCPDCGREVKLMKEESYFFRLSKYQDRILKLYEDNAGFLEPKSRQNEMINNFLKPGLQDLCVSRTTLKWGIPVPFNTKHVVYVWLDALVNYISALGYATDDEKLFKKFWPADLHMVGKEIVRFHSIIWPAFLMALNLPIPKKVYGHGWITFSGDKMSKSKGNIADPVVLSGRYGVDAVRYYLLREIPFGQDGNYTNSIFLNRVNNDLANDLGNLVSRTTAMIGIYNGGILPKGDAKTDADAALIGEAEGLLSKVADYMDKLLAPEALNEINKLAQACNKYIDANAPWSLQKSGNTERLNTVLYTLAETVRFIAVALAPFLPDASEKILASFSVPKELSGFLSLKKFGGLKAGSTVVKLPPLFPRIDIEKELKYFEEESLKAEAKAEKGVEEKENKAAKNTAVNAQKGVEEKENRAAEKSAIEGENKASEDGTISIEDFMKIKLKTALVVACEKVEKSEKLLKLTLKLGEETRTVVSGIAHKYSPTDLVGKNVVLVANLKPAKLKGILSEGMILCAEDSEHNLSIVSPEDKGFEDGSTVR
ncbi:MAG: methionine--tRNA ligase [Clostridiales bacterium]|nr:methionine--tRNA ligase [Clostridiales bacterium]